MISERDFPIGSSIRNRDLAIKVIKGAFREAYRRGWHPDKTGDADSARVLSEELEEACQQIDGGLLDELTKDSVLTKTREVVVQEIRTGKVDTNFFSQN